jgi:branched-chain amino acid transport system permease protein
VVTTTLGPSRSRIALRSVARAPYAVEVTAVVIIAAVTLLFSPSVPSGIYGLGVVSGVGTALSAVAVILIYRSNGFVNFAQLQMVSTASALFVAMNTGRPLLRMTHSLCGDCVGSNPGQVATDINFVLSLVLVVGFMIGLNWVLYLAIFQRFAKSSRLLLTLVSVFIGEALISLQTSAVNYLIPTSSAGDVSKASGAPFEFSWHLTSITLHTGDILLVIVGALSLIVLSRYLGGTSAGTAIRAASDNAERARTLGLDVTGVSSRVWMIAGALAAVVGILQAFSHGLPTSAVQGAGTSLTPQLPVEPLVLVLAAAVLAQFRSLSIALLASLALAVLEEGVQWSFGSTDPLNATLVVIVGVVLLLQRRRSGRAEESNEPAAANRLAAEPRPIPRELRQLPAVRRWISIGTVVVAVLLLGLPWLLSAGTTVLVTTFVTYAMVGLSLLVLTGWGGQVSLGQFGFAAIGAWTAAVSGLPFLLSVPLGALSGAVAALIVGLPALRLRGLNLAITSIAFALCAQTLFVGPRYLGSMLPSELRPPVLAGVDLNDSRSMYYALLLVLALLVLAVIGLRRSRTGRVLIACRENPAAAQAFGVNLLRVRLTAFMTSGCIAALAGALFAYQQARVNVASFTVDQSVQLTLFTAVGGLGGVAGPLFGFTVMGIIQTAATNPVFRYASAGLGGVILVLAVPGGIAQIAYTLRDAALRRLAIRHRIPVVSLLGDKLALSLGERAVLGESRAFTAEEDEIGYRLDGQWALARYGRIDGPKERVGD